MPDEKKADEVEDQVASTEVEEEEDESAFADAFDEIAGVNPDDDYEEDTGDEAGKPDGDEHGLQEEGAQASKEEIGGEQQTDEQAAAAEKTPAEQDAEYWRHKFQSDQGRVSALQKKINDLETKLNAGEATEAEVKSGTVEAFEELKKDFPEIATAVQSYVDEQVGQVAGTVSKRVKDTIEPLQEEHQDRFFAAQFEALEKAHPDYETVVKTAAWDQWLDSQPSQIRELANSDYANDVSTALSYFKGTQPAEEKGETDEVTSVMEKRKKQMEDARGISSKRSATPRKADPDDFEGAFEHYAKKA